MKKVYIVEDDKQITESLSRFLKKWSFDTKEATDFQRIMEDIREYQPDLVLLDISLPFYNGYYWCGEIRKESEVPIVFLSSASENMNIVMAMNLGADDFIPKPFDLEVLVAKIQAILRRTATGSIQKVAMFKEFSLDLETFEVTNGSEAVAITMNEGKILGMLFQNAGTIVPKEQLMEKLWESEEFIDSNTLSVNMTRLRKKVSDIGLDKYIQTEKGKGYCLREEEEL